MYTRRAVLRRGGRPRRFAARRKSLAQLFQSAHSAVVLSMKLYGEIAGIDDLPTTCPYTLEQILDPDFWPPEPAAQP